MSAPDVVIGAGLAGLAAARALLAGGREVLVLEAGRGVGGRAQTDARDGFLLDRGFQILLTRYPAVRRNFDLAALDLRPFEPGAVLLGPGLRETVADPLRSPRDLFASLLSSSLTMGDKLRILGLRRETLRGKPQDQLRGPDQTTESFLLERGFSRRAIDAFFRPFFGGIFLRRDLGTSARLFRYYFRALAEGDAALPARGIGALGAQLARGLRVRTSARVLRIVQEDGRATGVDLEGGERVQAASVVVATDPPELGRLCGARVAPELLAGSVSTTAVYYASDRALDSSKKLLLNTQDGAINSAVWLSNVAPTTAPAGQHLLSVSLLSVAQQDDDLVDRDVRRELSAWYGRVAVDALRRIAVVRVPFAQIGQAPGFLETLVEPRTRFHNVVVASDATTGSSVQGALESGEKAAALLLGDASALARPRGA